jgi:hypothetical protein
MFAFLAIAFLASASADCTKTNQIGSCGSNLHCCHDTGVLKVTHELADSVGSQHRCFINAADECQCECPTSAGYCVAEKLFTVTEWNGGSGKCRDEEGLLMSKRRPNKNCIFNSGRVEITHPHGYDALKAHFDYRELGDLSNSDFVKTSFRACTTTSASSCGAWSHLVKRSNAPDTNGNPNRGWSDWITKRGGQRAITPAQKYVEVRVQLKHNGRNEIAKVRNTEIYSTCE